VATKYCYSLSSAAYFVLLRWCDPALFRASPGDLSNVKKLGISGINHEFVAFAEKCRIKKNLINFRLVECS